MGTPVERDDEAEAVIDHLNAKGGIAIGVSPRVLVRGRYEGAGVVLHFRRRFDEGTYLHVDLKVDQEDVCRVVLDMCYPYGLSKTIEKPSSYDNMWRKTLKDQKTDCRTWIGIGYTAGADTDYVDCSEHLFPCSVGYGWHSPQCAKRMSGEWNWCTGGSACGKKAWMFQLTVFETSNGQIGQEKLSVELTYILFNKDEEGHQKTEISVAVNGTVRGSVTSVDKNDASLGHYDRSLLKRSAKIFVKSKRERARATHPPHMPAYLSQVYQAPEVLTGAPKVQGAERESEARMRCILQLLNSCEGFNMALLVQVLHDQLDAEATQRPFIEMMHDVLNNGGREVGTMSNLTMHLRHLPTEEVPYNAWESYPDILRVLLRILLSLRHAVGWGKEEVEIRSLVRRTFEMRTTWILVEGCRVCGKEPSGVYWKWHFPDMVLQCRQNEEDQPFDLEAALKRRIEDNQRKLTTCTGVRCR